MSAVIVCDMCGARLDERRADLSLSGLHERGDDYVSSFVAHGEWHLCASTPDDVGSCLARARELIGMAFDAHRELGSLPVAGHDSRDGT